MFAWLFEYVGVGPLPNLGTFSLLILQILSSAPHSPSFQGLQQQARYTVDLGFAPQSFRLASTPPSSPLSLYFFLSLRLINSLLSFFELTDFFSLSYLIR